MHKYRKLIPIVAVILVAFGVNLDQFGIDLEKLSGQSQTSTHQSDNGSQSSNRNNNANQNTTSADSSSTANRPHWSNTQPKINLKHVFEGEINRKEKPVGYHSRPGGKDPKNARVVSIKSGPNRNGVYTANIEIRDGGQWKSKFSSFFPDTMSEDEVIKAILHAFKNSKNSKKQPWSGPSGHGFTIQGYTASRGDINTAFPIYR